MKIILNKNVFFFLLLGIGLSFAFSLEIIDGTSGFVNITTILLAYSIFSFFDSEFKNKTPMFFSFCILILLSIYPMFVKSKKVGGEWASSGGLNPIEREGYISKYEIKYGINEKGINYKLLSVSFFILLIMISLNKGGIVLESLENYKEE